MIYTLVPMVKIFGLEKWVERLPSGIFLLLASVAFFFLAAKHVRNRWICLGGTFIFSILPWVFPISRTGIAGYTAMLLGMTAGWYFLIDAVGKRSHSSAFLAGICWAFAMCAHNIGRPRLP
jgi:4-amino-4-deoxy-L-arabinose transferase-like glycosyltransferase